MDILQLLPYKENINSVVRQEVVIDFEETRWRGTSSSMTVLMIWLVSEFDPGWCEGKEVVEVVAVNKACASDLDCG